MRVPPELIDRIFSFLRGEKSALQACSKAHPLFSRLVQPHLYADTLVPINNNEAVAELYKQFSENPRMLDFPRTLEFRRTGLLLRFVDPAPKVLSIMSMVPRMANLISLSLEEQPCLDSLYKDFLSVFSTCLQQSAIEEVCLESFHYFPLSLLDNGKNIKILTLSDCTARSGDKPISPHHQSLETLIIRGRYNPRLLLWTAHRATSLTTLELRDVSLDDNHRWTEFPELLTACSNSLRKLHLDVASHCQSVYRSDRQSYSSELAGRWFNGRLKFPFTLSAHTHLRELSIIAKLHSNTDAKIRCALPAIIRLIKSAPSVPDVVLKFCRSPLSDAGPIDSSPLLDRLWSDFPTSGICPCIDLHINDVWSTRGVPICQIIPDVLAMTEEDLTDL